MTLHFANLSSINFVVLRILKKVVDFISSNFNKQDFVEKIFPRVIRKMPTILSLLSVVALFLCTYGFGPRGFGSDMGF
jgi:hypothetical protein